MSEPIQDGRRVTELYNRVAELTVKRDFDGARSAFLAVCGLRPPDDEPPAVDPGSPPTQLAKLVHYHRPRRVDVLALEYGGRDVAKFEDLTAADARRMEAWAKAHGFRYATTVPYTKRTDIVIADDSAEGGLHAVVVSRGPQAEEIVEAERGWTPEGNRRAGLALGYPPCCVEHFLALSRDGLAFDDGVNEALLRSVAGIYGEAPWEMNLLSEMSPVGFTPCRVDCPHALAFARRVMAAIERGDPAGAKLVRETLQRPVLFFRFSLMHVLDGEPVKGEPRVRYRRSVQVDAATPVLNAWLHTEIGEPLRQGDSVTLDGGALDVRRRDQRVATWPVVDGRIPILFRFV